MTLDELDNKSSCIDCKREPIRWANGIMCHTCSRNRPKGAYPKLDTKDNYVQFDRERYGDDG
jgi:ribosomal protein L37AE/L43A